MQGTESRQLKKWRPGCCLASLIFLFFLLLLLFVLIFIVAPIIFKYSTEIQRSIIFPTWCADENNSNNESLSDIKSFGLNGVRNFYITVDEANNITLGCWHLLPRELLNKFIENDQYNYEAAISNNQYNILLYLHGNGGIRSAPLKLYDILRRTFNIISCDYRGYADSTKAELNENNIANDIVNLYQWVRNKTTANVFFWGHSLGTGVSTHTISILKKLNHTRPTGLVLETPFSSVTDVIEMHIIAKIFSWLPWFKATFLEPFDDHGFGFDNKKFIVDVDCPIMMLHAKDDEIVPYELATRLYSVAIENRNYTYQGNVTYHLFESKGYMHMQLYLAPELPTYISEFVQDCLLFKNQTVL